MKTTLLKRAFMAAAGAIFLLCSAGNDIAAEEPGVSSATNVPGTPGTISSSGIDSVTISYEHGAILPEYSSNRDTIAFYDVWGAWANERIIFELTEWRRITSFKDAASMNAVQSKVEEAAAVTDAALLRMFGVDTSQLQISEVSILQMYNGFYRNAFKWNRLQLEHLADTLNSRSLRLMSLRNYLGNNHQSSVSPVNYKIKYWRDGSLVKELETPKDLYAYFLDKLYRQGAGPAPVKYHKGKQLMAIFLNDYIENNWQKLYDLGWYDHKDIVEELSKEYDVAGKGQFWDHSKGGGKYTRNDCPQYIFSLKHSSFPQGVNVNFIATEKNGKLFPHSTMASICKDIVKKAVSHPAIGRLRENSDVGLQLYIFNDRPMNDYLMEWTEQLWRRKGIEKDEMEASIFVEIKKERKPVATMCLLPDNSIFMYSVRDDKELMGFDLPDDIRRTGYFDIYGELFTQEGKIIRAAGLDSISVTWKAGGDTDIYNVQMSPFWGWSDGLEEIYESSAPYVIRDSAVIGQIYSIFLNYKFGAFYEEDTDRKVMKELGLEHLSGNTMGVWKKSANWSKNDSLYFSRFKMNSRQAKFYRISFTDWDSRRRYMKYLLKGSVNYGVNHYGMVLHWADGGKDTLSSGRNFYSHHLTPYVKDVWPMAERYDLPKGDTLLKKLHQLYMLEHSAELHKLGKYDILPQLKELEQSFEVGEAGLLMDFGVGGGVYVQNDFPAYYAVLRTKDMHPRLQLKYVFEEKERVFAPFNNLKQDFGKIVERVQQTPFFSKLLAEAGTTLSVAYINDAPVSEYLLKRFWASHPDIFEKNPPEDSENRKAIFVECTQPDVWGDEQCYRTLCYLLMPNGDVMECGHGNRIFFEMDYKVDNPKTWRNNRTAVKFVFHPKVR